MSKTYQILGYNDFVDAVLDAGFTLGGGNDEGVFCLLPWSWDEVPPYESPVRWHTGDTEADPWQWRIRVLTENKSISYGKVFFKKAGFITREWAPYFIAARRNRKTFAQAYADGTMSQYAKRIYEAIEEAGDLAAHELKEIIGVSKDDKAAFERALVELQMKMYITICGERQKISAKGEAYSWPSSTFCTVESFWGEDVCAKAAATDPTAAAEAITERVYELNPNADAKKVQKLIRG